MCHCYFQIIEIISVVPFSLFVYRHRHSKFAIFCKSAGGALFVVSVVVMTMMVLNCFLGDYNSIGHIVCILLSLKKLNNEGAQVVDLAFDGGR